MSTPDGSAESREVYRRYLSAVVLHAQAGAKACGLGVTDLYALNILELSGPMTPGELAARTGLTTGPTTRLIDRLAKDGYVRRVPDADDRRKVVVEPVGRPAGLDRALAPARRRVAELIAGYSAEERAVLFDYFERAALAYQHAVDEME
ncbi:MULTISPECIES: MarR family winged helix-turn-helix transcriptional regulator [Nocardia]|uniref:MarR family winged helix-turn-helix transcriptional regulator n=1 Tax=Nocardia TaxID=1817 RepID=UPI000BF15153|nr:MULTISPECIES: MarR family transcriptional regulator [Nocardia]MBF6188033.1 MarR family transcriptional regulator [Nocardia farcinica]MBF6314516.1 MarR family transcriptional regulator [Nocardia farcinica]MBF6409919.1 MarR family transcriptional regulator [Nocardia farcinica]PEH75085.1 MarR family transcriptional regulator [Nocardia sp. FDAARGOS_372]UEX24623.1 MarR family transcriptional regulator [Nocardia farcinica]